MISRCEAYQHIIKSEPLPRAFTSLNKSLGLAFADKICAVRNYPSVDPSLTDRFAIVTDDPTDTSPAEGLGSGSTEQSAV